MTAFHLQPYPLLPFNEAVKRDGYFSLFLALFLLLFRPFGLHVYPYAESYIILGYGFITLFTTLANDYAAYHWLKKWFTESRWNILRQFVWSLWHLLCLGISNFLYAAAIGAFPWSPLGFLKVQLYVLLSALVPITLYILLRQNFLLKRNLAEARHLAGDLPPAGAPTIPVGGAAPLLTFQGENQKESLTLDPASLLYLESQDNYVRFVWSESGSLNKKMLRSPLAKFEETLGGYPAFFRCHRGYIVNLDRVRKISGNAQGYTLELEGGDQPVPVSRARGRELKAALQRPAEKP